MEGQPGRGKEVNGETRVELWNGSRIVKDHVLGVRGWDMRGKMNERGLRRWDVTTDEALWALGDGFVEKREIGINVREDLGHFYGATGEGAREHVIGAGHGGSETEVADEEDAGSRSCEGDETQVWGNEVGVLVEENGVWRIEGAALA